MTLDDAAQVTIGRQRSPKNASGPSMVRYMRAANVKDGHLALDDVLEMNFSEAEQETYRMERGDILVTEGCGSIRELGASARWDAQVAGTVCFQNTLLRLRGHSDVVLPGYLELWARWAHQSGIWASTASGTNIFHIGVQRARRVPILVPPIEVQRRIVHLVDAIDSAIASAHRVRGDLGLLGRSISVDWFENTGAESVLLGSLCEPGGIQIGPFGSQLHAHDYVDDGTPSVMPKDIVRNEISEESIARLPDHKVTELSRHRLKPGDILLPRRGDLTKRALVRPAQAGWLCGTGTVRIRVASVDPKIVFRALATPAVDAWLADNAVGVTMPNLNSGLVAAIPLRIPSGSQAVVHALDEIAASMAAASELSSKLAVTRSALATDLLSGNHSIPDSYDELLERAS